MMYLITIKEKAPLQQTYTAVFTFLESDRQKYALESVVNQRLRRSQKNTLTILNEILHSESVIWCQIKNVYYYNYCYYRLHA